MLPVISVLMTCYNRETLIAESIESVLKSDYSDFELIIVDDNSTDNSLEIIYKFAEIDPRIKVFANSKNLGDYPNRNYAASKAKGKYIKYVDSDDLISSNCLREMVNSMENYPEAALGICANTNNYPIQLYPSESYETHFFKFPLFNCGPLHYIIKTEKFKKAGGFKNERMTSDSDMWYKLALNNPVVLIKPGLVWQRLHPNQELKDQNKFIVSGAKIKWVYLLNPECKLSRDQIKLIRKNRIKRYSIFIISSLKKLNFLTAIKYGQCLQFCLKLKV